MIDEKLLKFVEDLADVLRYHEHILQNEDLKECHEQSQICKDVLTPIYYDIKDILQSFEQVRVKKMKTKKLYRCPQCGTTITEEMWLKDLECGGSGYCICEFKDGERTLYDYDVYHLSTQKVK